jgi:hypothetical protein
MTKRLTRRSMIGGVAAMAGLAVRNAAAADWPARTITIIHGLPAAHPTSSPASSPMACRNRSDNRSSSNRNRARRARARPRSYRVRRRMATH